jgi:hypothetical protein
MRTGRIENWQEVDFLKQKRIVGNVYECPDFKEGELFMSSPIEDTFYKYNAKFVRSASGSTYMLGAPSTENLTVQEIFKREFARINEH